MTVAQETSFSNLSKALSAVIEALNENVIHLETNDKNRRIITLGTWKNKPVKWLVLKEDTTSYFCVSENALFNHCFNDNLTKGSDYSTSDIRKFLNNEFYNDCFNESEKHLIMNHKITGEFYKDVKDYVFLLSTSEVEQLMNDAERIIGRYWYTRTSRNSNFVYANYSNSVGYSWYGITNSYGIRPAILIRK